MDLHLPGLSGYTHWAHHSLNAKPVLLLTVWGEQKQCCWCGTLRLSWYRCGIGPLSDWGSASGFRFKLSQGLEEVSTEAQQWGNLMRLMYLLSFWNGRKCWIRHCFDVIIFCSTLLNDLKNADFFCKYCAWNNCISCKKCLVEEARFRFNLSSWHYNRLHE